MGTRSLTYVYSDQESHENKPFLCMYRQFDGYPEGHGKELAEFLTPIELINGISQGQDILGSYANGMACLAAQMVKHFKNSVGGIYLHMPDPVLNADGWQEYEYHIFPDKIQVVTCGSRPDVLFTGTWEQFAEWINNFSKDEEENEPSTDEPLTLRSALAKGVVEVTFIKADGSRRVMSCTTNPKLIPEDKLTNHKNIVKVDPDLYRVYDLQNGWRSFRRERVINWVVFGM